jgi:hypothetical protein
MISDATGTGLVSQLAALQLVPHGTNLGVTVGENGAGFIQPVTNVLERLKTRRPRPCFEGEEDLLITLTEDGQEEVKALNMACLFVKNLSKGKHGLSVSAACERALSLYANNRWLRKLTCGPNREIGSRW